MSDLAKHRIRARRGDIATAIRMRVEHHLDVETTCRPEGDEWAVYFDAPKDVDLGFLRPDILPPKEAST